MSCGLLMATEPPMELRGGFLPGRHGLLQGGKISQVISYFVNRDMSNERGSGVSPRVAENTLDTARCFSVLPSLVGAILRFGRGAKIADAIVQAVAVFVVDQWRNGFSAFKKPDQTMGLVSALPGELDRPIDPAWPALTQEARCFPGKSFVPGISDAKRREMVRRSFPPPESAGASVVGQAFANEANIGQFVHSLRSWVALWVGVRDGGGASIHLRHPVCSWGAI